VKKIKKDTKLSLVGRKPFENFGIVNPPIYRTSTVLFKNTKELGKAITNRFNQTYYGRYGTPTTFALESGIAEIENGYRTVATSSGMSSISISLLSFLSKDEHCLISDCTYYPTKKFASKILSKFGVKIDFYDPTDIYSLKKKINKKTKVIFMESPASLTLEIEDVSEIIRIAKKKKIITMLDNSWATPFYFSPIDIGVDISILAATKYISGHADIMLGLITVKNEKLFLKVKDTAVSLGDCPGPQECYLSLRGLRTLSTRLEHHRSSALKIARFLENNDKVYKVFHPALVKNENYELWNKYFSGSTGLFSFILKEQSKNKVYKMINKLNLFKLGFSWGGYESLILPVFPKSERKIAKWNEKGILLRIHVGLENVNDLIVDLKNAFKL
jgi:cystathionine beta-lyase